MLDRLKTLERNILELKDARDRILQRNGYIASELAAKVYGMVGLRNILVHDYIAIDDAKLYGLLDQVDDMSEFAIVIAQHLQK